MAVAALLLPLAWFKYYGFFALNLANAFESIGLEPPLPLLQVLLPIGISFYTFMAISYVVDVSRYEIQVVAAGSTCRCTSRSSRTWSPGRSSAARS